MIVLNINPVAFSIGPFDIRWYSLSYIFGILISWLIINKVLIKHKNEIDSNTINNLINYLILGIIIGGRIGYVLFYNFEFYLNHPMEIIKIWNGGMSFHGGLLGIIISTYAFCINQKESFFDLTDLLALVAPIGIFFGRIANFVNGELYGRITESSMGIIFLNGGPLPRHPSQLYEALFEGIILYLILNFSFFLTKLKKYKGSVTGLFLLLYGFFRFFIEYFREPDNQIGLILNQFTMGQILCAPMIIIGIIIFKHSLNYKKNG